MTIVLFLISVALGVYWCVGDINWLMPGWTNPVADRSRDVDDLVKFMSVFASAIQVFVTGYVIYFVVAFRARPSDPSDAIGVPVHDSPKLEFWWTILPSALLAALSAMSIVVWYKIYFGTSAPALTAEVVAHQFYFEVRYPGMKTGVATNSEPMHLPVGVPIRLLITSGDVIHQFWVPELRLKTAGVPGLVQNLNFTADHTGTYDITCTEFCGAGHSVMQGKIVFDQVPAFNTWLNDKKKAEAAAGAPIALTGGDAGAGKALFASKCSACHNNPPTPFDQKLVGPGLAKLTDDPAHPNLVNGKPPTPENIAGILQNGFSGDIGTMPNRQANGLSDKDIANLVAYLVSIK